MLNALTGFNPRPREGATDSNEVTAGQRLVSIHAPVKGRLWFGHGCLSGEGFQSTPP